MCKLTYSIEGKVFLSDGASCEDFCLETRVEKGRKAVLLTAKRDLTLLAYEEGAPEPLASQKGGKRDLYFLNGYQSWTDSKERYLSEKERGLRHLPKIVVDAFAFDRYGDYTFYPYAKNKLHGYDVFYVKGQRRGFLLNLNYKRAYLLFEVNRRTGEILLRSDVKGAVVKAGSSFPLIDYLFAPDYQAGMRAFKEVFPPRDVQKLFGYTSWYNYYQNINEQIILRDLDALDERFNLFQIDDGYQTFVGDWLDVDENKFPNGLSFIPEKAHARGFKAGIWLAPFVAEEKSRLFREHPEFFKRDRKGAFVKCGSNWSGFYALDLEKPEVKDYVKTCLRHYADMGFDLFKLDFLYAASLPEYDGKTRSEAAEESYAFLREVLADKLILGCGATTFNAEGKFDYLRVGTDVSLSFDDAFYMRLFHRERPSTKATLQNTIYRSFMDGAFFGNDPDVFLLREENLSLSEGNKRALLTVNALFGSVLMTSDNIGAYDKKQKEELDRAFGLFYNAKVNSFAREGRRIKISYEHNGRVNFIEYDIEKGVII